MLKKSALKNTVKMETDTLIKIGEDIEITDCRKILDVLTKDECRSCEDYDSVKNKCTRYGGFEKNPGERK